jgi:hypothetical protein
MLEGSEYCPCNIQEQHMLTPQTAGMIIDTSATDPADDRADAIEGIVTLHTRTVDAMKGYAKMVQNAETKFRPVAQQFHDVHTRHAAALSVMLASAGREVDENGSFIGTVNATVVSLRAFFDEIDEDVMESVRSGEDHVLKAFDGALEYGLPTDQASELAHMRDELVALLDQTRHLD